jgi:hypothetical protein
LLLYTFGSRFIYKRWVEVFCKKSDALSYFPDAILDKASRAEEVQSSGRQTPWSGRSGLNMKIACSRSATIRTLGQHCPDAALFRKEFQANLESRLHSCLSERPQLLCGRYLRNLIRQDLGFL